MTGSTLEENKADAWNPEIRSTLPAKYLPDVKTKAYPTEKDYFLFSSPPRSLEQIQNIQAEMPKGEFTYSGCASSEESQPAVG